MGLFLQALYSNIFLFFCLPIFGLMLIGKPRFMIKLVHKILNIQEPFRGIKVFRFLNLLCLITVIWSYYRKWHLENIVAAMGSGSDKAQNPAGGINFIDEKLREAHLFERNTYMFLTFFILSVIVEKFCQSYFKLWKIEDKAELVFKEKKQPIKGTEPGNT